jgi:dsRNA-specific ribonuclease
VVEDHVLELFLSPSIDSPICEPNFCLLGRCLYLKNITLLNVVSSTRRRGSDSNSDAAKGGRKIYADTMEAIIGAIYRDKGYDSAKETVDRWLN